MRFSLGKDGFITELSTRYMIRYSFVSEQLGHFRKQIGQLSLQRLETDLCKRQEEHLLKIG